MGATRESPVSRASAQCVLSSFGAHRIEEGITPLINNMRRASAPLRLCARLLQPGLSCTRRLLVKLRLKSTGNLECLRLRWKT